MAKKPMMEVLFSKGSRSVGSMFVKGKRIHTRKWQRCVKKVKKAGKAKKPEAVCTKALGKESFLKRAVKR